MLKVSKPQKYYSEGKVIGYRSQWTMPDGKRKGRVFPFAQFDGDKTATYQAALAELRRVGGELQTFADGRRLYDPEAEKMTLRQVFNLYWKPERSALKRRPKDDDDAFAHLKTIETIPVRRVGMAAVQTVAAELREKGLSKQSQKKVLGFLRAILNHAHTHDPIVNPPSFRNVIPRPDPFEGKILTCEAQVNAFLEAVERDDARTLYTVAVYAGLRAGELAGLRWMDIDLEKQMLQVCRSYSNPPKTGKFRSVCIVDRLLPYLIAWKKKAGTPSPEDLVFPSTETGDMWVHDSRIFRQVFHAALKKAEWPEKGRHELPLLRFHDLRHTFASLWIMEGGDPYQLLKMGGWSSFKMVEERYGKFSSDRYRGTGGMFSFNPPVADASAASDSKLKQKTKRKSKGQSKKRQAAGTKRFRVINGGIS